MINLEILSTIEDIQNAIFPVFKPLGWTSFDVVNYIKGRFKIKKIGHCGTLDPLATGVLLICTGINTKKISDLQKGSKSYSTKICLGATTQSLDGEYFPLEFIDINNIESINNLTVNTCNTILQDNFEGEIQQVPPIFSALKHNGKPLYTIARGEEKLTESEIKQLLVTKTRQVFIFSINCSNISKISINDLPCNKHKLFKSNKQDEILAQELQLKNKAVQEHKNFNLLTLSLNITCSSGTYIRSIARDIGVLLNIPSYMIELDRTEEYGYTIQA